jgi:hypothetical protein
MADEILISEFTFSGQREVRRQLITQPDSEKPCSLDEEDAGRAKRDIATY